MEEEGRRAAPRSFRREDYVNRRVFLRSYPLQWDDGDDGDQVGAAGRRGRRGGKGKAVAEVVESLKHRVVVAVIHLGEAKVLLLRKLKSKGDVREDHFPNTNTSLKPVWCSIAL
ncbi:hypothetical protein Taro_015591 [Colocasia esculenta]|uniref:Uncharacterized protein n=1 Tax=Colocasia esculenta TaxID=4460 RepID=A0A843UHY2_COLES|nr:hypothetical protein [Colocasia esculenta]